MASSDRPPFDPEAKVARQSQLQEVGVGGDDRIVGRPEIVPTGVCATEIKGWLAVQDDVDGPVEAGGRTDEHVVGVEVAGGTAVEGRAILGAVPGS